MVSDWEFTIENEAEFEKLLKDAKRKIGDLSVPFRLISSAWFRRNNKIFTLKSEGKYAPLGGFNPNAPSGYGSQSRRERAETLKERKTGRPWAPILWGITGKLKEATTGGKGSILHIKPDLLRMGVDGRTVPYGKYHQSDSQPRTKLPQRKFIFISGGKDKAQDSIVGNDLKTWTAILNDHVEQVLTGSAL